MGKTLDLVPMVVAVLRFFGVAASKKRTYAILGGLALITVAPGWLQLGFGAAQADPERISDGVATIVEAEVDDALPLGLNPIATVVTVVGAAGASAVWPRIRRRLT